MGLPGRAGLHRSGGLRQGGWLGVGGTEGCPLPRRLAATMPAALPALACACLPASFQRAPA